MKERKKEVRTKGRKNNVERSPPSGPHEESVRKRERLRDKEVTPTTEHEATTKNHPPLRKQKNKPPTKKHKSRSSSPSHSTTTHVAEHMTAFTEDLLADELLCHILRMLPKEDVVVAARTCRRWYAWCPSHLRKKLSIRWACSSLAAVQWACLQAGCPLNERICDAAALNGHAGVLRWARENGCPWYEQTCEYAAMSGHLEVLQWAREHGCPWDERTCFLAASAGHLNVLQWARENGCPWDNRTSVNAAKNGHLEVLQWAVENGCPWDPYVCALFATGYHPEVVDWIATKMKEQGE